MFTVILFLILCRSTLCHGGTTDYCTKIAQFCYKCKGLATCIDGSSFKTTPEGCVSHVMTHVTSVAAHYFPDRKKCRAYTCGNNLLFTDSDRFAVRKTCNIDCSNFTLSEHLNSKVTAVALSSAIKSLGQCFEDCFETVGCYTFSYGGGVCNIYTSCGSSCTTGFWLGTSVYTRSCHGGIQMVDCGTLASPANGAVHTSSGTSFHNHATYTCSTGYTLIGTSTRTCQADGQWSGSEPHCRIKDCGSLTSPLNGVVSTSSGTAYKNQAKYECFTGYILVGSNFRICQSDGKWTGSSPVCNADCGDVTSPPNGDVDTSGGTAYSNQAIYKCSDGYTLVGASFRICQSNGQWSGSEPYCDLVNCGSLRAPDNGNVQNPAVTTYLEQATFLCSTGYNLTGNDERTCQSNGSWSGTSPSCTAVDCGPPIAPKHGVVVTTNGTTYRQNATFSCNNGYKLKGVDTSQCNASGFWDSSPDCNLIDCGFLIAPEHGVVNYENGTTYGEIATFLCDTRYHLSHINNRTCLSTGLWSMSTPLCILNDLSTPEPVRLYIAPCICYPNKTFANMSQQEITSYLIKQTRIERNSTVLARRKLNCAKDSRISSQIVGYTGVVIIAGVLGVILLSDVMTFCQWLE